jgi:LysM repeat protein
MSRPLAVLLSLVLIAAADGPPPSAPLPHASGQAAAPGPGCGGRFTAARNDTLYSIARRCQSSVPELVQENRLGHPPRLAAGQALAIPGFAAVEAPKPPEVAPPPLPPRVVPPPRPMPPRPEAPIYIFQAGDTLYSLARWSRVSLAALRAANPDIVATDIDAGDPIRLPRGASRPEPMRLRERGRPVALPAVAPAPPPPVARPPRPSVARPAPPPPPREDADKPKPDDEAGDAPDGDDEPDAMGM